MRWPWRRVLVDGDYVEPVQVPTKADARRITLTASDLRAGQSSWLRVDDSLGRLEAILWFPTGTSYAVRIPSEIARPLLAFLDGAGMAAVAELIKEDLKTKEPV